MLTRVDDLIRIDHSYLEESDECLFRREYTPRVGYEFSSTNDLIQNFKKPIDRRGRAEYWYKGWAIRKITEELSADLDRDWLKTATLVPIPPSKSHIHPLYDDRMIQVLKGISGHVGFECDIREIILQSMSYEAAHTTADRPSLVQIQDGYTIDERLADPAPRAIGIFDDVLTTGAHFKAAKNVLAARFPGIPIVGIFVARVTRL